MVIAEAVAPAGAEPAVLPLLGMAAAPGIHPALGQQPLELLQLAGIAGGDNQLIKRWIHQVVKQA